MRYSIEGEPFPVVICDLEAGEEMITESGAMSWMSNNMNMATQGGGLGKMFGRMVSGETIFLNRYTATGGPGMIAFASSFPGSIRAYEIGGGKEIIAQKRAFLAATSGVELSIAFQKKVGSGFFGGEGFIMQKLSGNGMAFLEFDGYVKEYTLQPGQQMIIDTGYLAAMENTCSIDIQMIKGVKNVLFGGEGLFNTVLTGPGRIWIQSMPIPQLASTLVPYLPIGKNN
ncbi:TIGR00266 family protein [Oribacterium sp. C9]|uniref:TIGR00266 family protein n=1 Tax=Oribacterium sp. C9 TaxID=1943579 RepID=UPI00098FFC83|nr:TIGR00266 family protein [Oribacterium sp. C9]OON86537.1 TIGR00266 family protein [Oribacterium sp. C9]